MIAVLNEKYKSSENWISRYIKSLERIGVAEKPERTMCTSSIETHPTQSTQFWCEDFRAITTLMQEDSTLFSYTGGLTCTVGFLYMVYPRPCVSCKNFARLMHYQKNLNSAEQCSTRSSLGQSQRLLFLSEVSVTASSSPYEGQLSILPDVIECNESQL